MLCQGEWENVVTSSFFLLVVWPVAPLVASLLLVAMPFVTSSDALLQLYLPSDASAKTDLEDATCFRLGYG